MPIDERRRQPGEPQDPDEELIRGTGDDDDEEVDDEDDDSEEVDDEETDQTI